MTEWKTDLRVILTLSRRNLKLFLRDKATVFFSLLAPLIILVLYVLFLRDVQFDSVMSAFQNHPEVSEKTVAGFVDSWMIAGVLSVCCLTVALSSMTVMVSDRERGIVNDYLTAPIRPICVTLSYFLAFFAVTVFISLLVFAVGLVFLVASGSFLMSAADVFETLGIIVLSCFSSTMVMLFLLSFFRSTNATGAFTGIFCAAIGFLTGSYMPISIFPTAVQYVTNFIPGSYSAGLFRNVFMRGALGELAAGAPAGVVEELKQTFSFQLNFFGTEIGTGWMYAILAFSFFLFLAVHLVVKHFAGRQK